MTHKDNDIEFVEDEDYSGEASIKDKLKKIKEKLKTCDGEKKDNLAGWQRAKADLINLKKSMAADRPQLMDLGKENIIVDLLPALDAFSMAMGNKERWMAVDEQWRVGVEYIYSQIMTALEQNGLELIDPQAGESIDINIHDVVGEEIVESGPPPGLIYKIRRKGYRFKEIIIRPAEVIITKEN